MMRELWMHSIRIGYCCYQTVWKIFGVRSTRIWSPWPDHGHIPINADMN